MSHFDVTFTTTRHVVAELEEPDLSDGQHVIHVAALKLAVEGMLAEIAEGERLGVSLGELLASHFTSIDRVPNCRCQEEVQHG